MKRNYKKPVSKAINLNTSALLSLSDPELKTEKSNIDDFNLANERGEWQEIDDMFSF